MYIAEIVFTGDNGWDVSKTVSLPFKNPNKCRYFASYYSSKNDVLIRLYDGNWFFESFVGGKEIWNAF